MLPYLDIPFQHAQPARAESDAPPRARGEHAGAHPRAGARSALTSPSARPSSSAFPARPSRISQLLLDWLSEARLDRVGCFKYEPSKARRPMRLPDHVPDEVKEERWDRFMGAAGDQRRALAAQVGQTDRRPRRRRSTRKAPSRARRLGCAGDRRHGLSRWCCGSRAGRPAKSQDRRGRRIRSLGPAGASRVGGAGRGKR